MKKGIFNKSMRGRMLEESGITMLEMILASAMSLLVLGAALGILMLFARQQPRVSEHGQRVQEVRLALERMTKDLRQTYEVNSSSSTSIDVRTFKRTDSGEHAVQRRVVYDCYSGSCTRQEGPIEGTLGSQQPLITDVTNTDIFSYEPDLVNPTFLRIKLRFDVKESPNDPAGPKTLSEGVQLRNSPSQG